jgi:hypothetical protein
MRRSIVALVVFAGGLAHGVPPSVIPWQEAGRHVGRVVTVEGDVVRAQSTSETCVLEFDADDDRAFRTVLLLPLFSSIPTRPERLYQGKRVRVSGNIVRFQGRPEMILRSPGQIEVVSPERAETTPEPAPAPPPTPAPPPRVAPEPAPRTPPPPAVSAAPAPTLPPRAPDPVPPSPEPAAPTREVTAPAPPTTIPPPREPAAAPIPQTAASPCIEARARWRTAAAAARAQTSALERCLAGASYRCRTESAALAPLLTTLEQAEQNVTELCY